MVFVSVTDAPATQKAETPPPSAALFPITVLLTSCPPAEQLLIAPPRLVDVLPVNVEFSTAKGPKDKIAPPGLPKPVALLSVNVLALTLRGPLLQIAPPPPLPRLVEPELSVN